MIEYEASHWIDDLIYDAKDEKAPQQLRENAAVVRQYLGIGADDPLTREHYTRFASRFEQYVALNTAPSKAMAAIFAEFREWLVTIYQTAEQSSGAISPEIRKWFEQSVLAQRSQRVVIVPDKRSEARPVKPLQTTSAAKLVPRVLDHCGRATSGLSLENAYYRNMQLSQDRTRAVLEYVLGLPKVREPHQLYWLIRHLTANGLSSSKPILILGTNKEDQIASQRVEFRVRTNADQRLEKILKALRR